MSLRTDLLSVVEDVRAITGPDDLDLRTSRLTIRTRTWAQGYRSSIGTFADSDLVLPQHYKIRQVSNDEVVSSGGRYEVGDVLVGPITPDDGTGKVGFTPNQLDPHITVDGVEVFYVLTGVLDGEYDRFAIDTDRNFRYMLHLRRRRTTP